MSEAAGTIAAVAEQPRTVPDDDGLCCGQHEPAAYAPKKGQPRNLSCIGCPESPTYWNREGDAELRPLGERD